MFSRKSQAFQQAGLCAALLFLSTAPAFAHHAMSGETPFTFEQGLISGIAHPVIGFDHLAFIIGVGIASAFISARFVMPLLFVGGTVAGCMLTLQGVTLPIAEIVIAATVVMVGAMILSGAKVPASAYGALFAIAGLFHGWAYGGSIVGAEQTPLLAYLIGFAAIQYLIAAAIIVGARAAWDAANSVPLRIAGGGIAGFGFAFLVENIEGLILPGVA
ncbi:MAG: HupE/UreJ family protein [Hyphomicrobiales bacterium]|nr:HupE/UreJ family protein [Hyphomicrobiales bacterium]